MRFLIGGRVRFLVLLAVMVAAVAALPAGATPPATNGQIAFGFGDAFAMQTRTVPRVHQLGVPGNTAMDQLGHRMSSKILCKVFSENGPAAGDREPGRVGLYVSEPGTFRSISSASSGCLTAPAFSATARGSRTRQTRASTPCGPRTRAASSAA